jgi:hypothetical protein
METAVDLMLFALALRPRSERSVLYLTGEPLTYYRVYSNSISAKAYCRLEASRIDDTRPVERMMWLLKVNRWHSREAGELLEGCKCNDYEFFATYDRLKVLYLPTRLARGLS